MKKTLVALAFLSSAICWAQPPADCKPSSLNIAGAPYPCVLPDHRAIFRVSALSTGSAEGPRVKEFSDALTNDGVHNIYFESPGTAHEWLTWRRALKDFAPRLFR